MEKLDLQIFRELKQEIVDMFTRLQEADEREEDIPEEEVQKQVDRYKEIIDTLSQYDLSDIDFEEWRGMYLLADDEMPIDFSKTKANLDFSIITYMNTYLEGTPNFKSCQIKNFDFDEYNPDMFDEEFKKENKRRFLSPDIPDDVAERFFQGRITLTDIKNNPELANKVRERNIIADLRDIYKLIGREEFCKLDAEFIDGIVGYMWTEIFESNPNLRTAEEIMPVLYRNAREIILGYSNDTDGMNYFYKQDELGETFRQLNPDLFLNDDVPENIRYSYYHHSLSLREFSENLDFFEGKKIAHALSTNADEKKLVSLYGDNIYQLFVDYKPMIDKILFNNFKFPNFEVPNSPITEEQRTQIMRTIVSSYFTDIDKIGDLPMLKMVMDFVPLEDLKFKDERVTTILSKSDIDVLINAGLNFQIIHSTEIGVWKSLSGQEIKDFIERYGEFVSNIPPSIFYYNESQEERENAIQNYIEENILNRELPYDESIPEFFKQRHPEMFLDENAPEELKKAFYDNKTSNREYVNISGDVIDINFTMIKEHPEWREFLQGKDLSRAFSIEYSELFKRFDSSTLMKLGTRNPETIEKMVQNRKEELLEGWYKSTGGKFVPHHVVMLNFPEGEIDSFLGNSKRWSQLMRIENYNLNDDGKSAILKVAYAMGVFQGDDDGFNKTMKLFTDVPQELTQEEYEKVENMFERFGPDGNVYGDISYDEDAVKSFRTAYTPSGDGKYVFSMDKQKNKDVVKLIRGILEHSNIDRILTPIKAHQMFGSFKMEYNPDFVRFFNENVEEILSNPEFTKDIATIQRQFSDIVRTNAGRRLTLDVAQDYIKSIAYTDIEIRNEGVAEQAKIAGYSQKDFEAIQSLFNEGEVRDFSSIPRIQGRTNGYTYEMLRCDDPLALTIGTLTDCCQEIHGAGQTSMEHSVVSPDGRVFCVRDAEGRLVAQSWFWRNQYTGCFDNIEIPHRIFELYKKQHPDIGRKGLTSDVLEVYKKAAQDLMQEDARVYQELLENGTITQEQYNSLLLGKVTIGLGYNDIADAIRTDKTIHEETDKVGVKGTDRLPYPYTDAGIQYTIAEREGTVKSEHENLYVHQDDVPVYDGTNMSSIVLLTMKRMEQATDRENLAYLSERSDEADLPRSKRIINSIAREYGLDPDSTKVMATARIALIYSKNKDRIKIGDLLSSPLKKGLTEEQKQKGTAHIMHQVKKALKQIGTQDSELDISSLSEEQQQMLQSVMQEIEKENDERGER